MKKLLILGLVLMVCALSTFAVNMNTGIANTATSKTVTVNIVAKARYAPVIYSIYNAGTTATAVYIQKGNTTGTTSNYTTIATVAPTALNGNEGLPVFVGDVNYGYRIYAAAATNNTLIVNYKYGQ